MRGFTPAGSQATLRARRWDAIVLGGALPGMVTAARLGMRGLRVLLVEEEAAAKLPVCLREPFLLSGPRTVLDACLRELTLALIDRRRIRPQPVAYQVVTPDARIDVGELRVTAEELATWGLADPDSALSLVQSLERAARAEAEALLAAQLVRAGGLRGRVRAGGAGGAQRPSRHERGLPAEVTAAPPELAAFLEAQVRALSNLAGSRPPPEARARLLGAGLEGGAGFAAADESLRGLLRRRVQAVHAELRSVDRAFEFVSVDGHPALALDGGREVWVGRALVVNTECGSLAGFLREEGKEIPPGLDAPPPAHRRRSVHLRAPRREIPEGMAPRLILVDDLGRPGASDRALTLRVHPAAGDRVDLVASAVVAEGESRDLGDETARWIAQLMPFSDGRIETVSPAAVRWDDETALADPGPGQGWPSEVEIRVSSRPPVYRLPREGLAGLGLEGDLVLGLRAGDAIAGDLGR